MIKPDSSAGLGRSEQHTPATQLQNSHDQAHKGSHDEQERGGFTCRPPCEGMFGLCGGFPCHVSVVTICTSVQAYVTWLMGCISKLPQQTVADK